MTLRNSNVALSLYLADSWHVPMHSFTAMCYVRWHNEISRSVGLPSRSFLWHASIENFPHKSVATTFISNGNPCEIQYVRHSLILIRRKYVLVTYWWRREWHCVLICSVFQFHHKPLSFDCYSDSVFHLIFGFVFYWIWLWSFSPKIQCHTCERRTISVLRCTTMTNPRLLKYILVLFRRFSFLNTRIQCVRDEWMWRKVNGHERVC